MIDEKQPLTTSALLKYMHSCNRDAMCSVQLLEIDNPNGLPILELHWTYKGAIHAIVMTEGNLYRDNTELQIEFNKVRKMYDNLKEVRHESIDQ